MTGKTWSVMSPDAEDTLDPRAFLSPRDKYYGIVARETCNICYIAFFMKNQNQFKNISNSLKMYFITCDISPFLTNQCKMFC